MMTYVEASRALVPRFDWYYRWTGTTGRAVYCLGRTASGQPRHPLYVKAATPLEPWWP